MPIITTTSLPDGIVGSAYSQAIVAAKNNLSLEISRTGPGVLADGSGVDDQGNVNWDDTIILTYTIDNTGDDDLASVAASTPTIIAPLDAIGISAVISSAPASTIQATGSTTFEVTITLTAAIEWTVGIEITSDADAPGDSYTFQITGTSVDPLYGPPMPDVFTLGVSQVVAPTGSVQALDQPITFNDGSVVAGADLAVLAAAAEWAVDFARGSTAAYQTTDTTTAATTDGDPIYSIYPEKTPTGSTAIKLLDSNTTNHGTYKDAAGYNIGGFPVLSLANSTDGLYYPCNSSDVQQTDNSNYISTTPWWCAWCIRVRDGADTTNRVAIRAEGVPRLYVQYVQDDGGGSTAFSLQIDATGGAASGPNSAQTRASPGIKFYGAGFWDGTDYHSWGNTTVRTDQTPGSSLTLNALNSTSPMIFGLSNSQPVDIQAWYQGDQLTGGTIAGHINALQELVENFASR